MSDHRGVIKDGVLRVTEEQRWHHRLAELEGRDIVVTIEPLRYSRTHQQSRWYWGVIVPAVGDVLSITRDVPLNKDQVHEVLRVAFLGVDQTMLGSVAKSTRSLTTTEFSEYCERIRAHAASEWGLDIPDPE